MRGFTSSRWRFVAGLAATAAFAFALAADVRASVCAAECELLGSAAAMAADADPRAEAAPMDDCMGEHEPDRGAQSCPLSAPGTGTSCTGAASLPASVPDLGSSPEDALLLPSPGTEPHLLVADALFHPPRP
jgi:hypothetical protein